VCIVVRQYDFHPFILTTQARNTAQQADCAVVNDDEASGLPSPTTTHLIVCIVFDPAEALRT
jgi:hypothetical protein